MVQSVILIIILQFIITQGTKGNYHVVFITGLSNPAAWLGGFYVERGPAK
ncbi:hypothetical protein SD77_2307 [Bacillus badius]|uniref:Uncharacterized protein n=1 Tax=Bacillus badius TaxID=1455 RepID=A0ABR5AYP0_BACBA|nr:hypothetical protein SD77_2307 [Bacillus badius]